MPLNSDVVEAFNSFVKYSSAYINNISPTDLYSSVFVEYYRTVGNLIINFQNSISRITLENAVKIYDELNSNLVSNSSESQKVIDTFIKNHQKTESVLMNILEIEVISSKAYEIYPELRKLRLNTFKVIEEILATVKERENLKKYLEETSNKTNQEQIKLLQEQLKFEVERIKSSLQNETSKEFAELSDKSKKDAQEIENLRKQMQIEIEEIKERYKNDLSDFEFIKQEEIFTKTAEWNKKSSYIWTGILISFLIILIIYACYIIKSCWSDTCGLFATYGNKPQEYLRTLFYTDISKNILIRLFLLSIIVLLIKYSMKHINALMHNFTVNMHKANSLAAAMRIINTIPNDATRDVILTAAAKEIFTQQKTGYLNKEGEKFDFSIIDKLSSIIKKG